MVLCGMYHSVTLQMKSVCALLIAVIGYCIVAVHTFSFVNPTLYLRIELKTLALNKRI